MRDVPFYDDIGRTPVRNAPFCCEQVAEKKRWDTHVRECLRLLTRWQLASKDEQRQFLNDLLELLHHATASLASHLCLGGLDRYTFVPGSSEK